MERIFPGLHSLTIVLVSLIVTALMLSSCSAESDTDTKPSTAAGKERAADTPERKVFKSLSSDEAQLLLNKD